MNITCATCGRSVDHASPGCAEHARREAAEIHRAHVASGGSAEHCPVCAAPAAANRAERRQGMGAEVATLRALIEQHEAAARVHAEERHGLCAELARVRGERDATWAALREYAPRCSSPDCDEIATTRTDGDAYDHRAYLHCDACAGDLPRADLPHAAALRAAGGAR